MRSVAFDASRSGRKCEVPSSLLTSAMPGYGHLSFGREATACSSGCAGEEKHQRQLPTKLTASWRDRAIGANRGPPLTRLRSLSGSLTKLMRPIRALAATPEHFEPLRAANPFASSLIESEVPKGEGRVWPTERPRLVMAAEGGESVVRGGATSRISTRNDRNLYDWSFALGIKRPYRRRPLAFLYDRALPPKQLLRDTTAQLVFLPVVIC